MRIEPRTAWSARPPKSVAKIAPTPRLWLHHSVTGTAPTAQILRQIQNYHMDGRGWQDFAYSFAVDTAGKAWTGRGPLVAGGHTAGYNTTSHAVVAIGNFQTTTPTPALIEGLAQIAAHGYRQGWWTCRGYTGGHRMVAATACPGDRLNAQIPAINRRVEQLLGGAKPAPSPSKPPTSGGLTMSEAAKIRAEMKKANATQNAVIAELGKQAEARAAENRFFAGALRDLAGQVADLADDPSDPGDIAQAIRELAAQIAALDQTSDR